MDEYLALPDGAGSFPQDFSGPVVLRDIAGPFALHLQGYHLLWPNFPERFTRSLAKECWLFPVRSPLLGESRLISLPPGT